MKDAPQNDLSVMKGCVIPLAVISMLFALWATYCYSPEDSAPEPRSVQEIFAAGDPCDSELLVQHVGTWKLTCDGCDMLELEENMTPEQLVFIERYARKDHPMTEYELPTISVKELCLMRAWQYK